ncbi:hypothetical protein WJX81_004298 [Elliptochloris bilobata]|uniref:FAS1 domain-containing protein n=1 Tax=Elliptochloris bilobata TaxID=381761 RepID=A0AAW1QXI9_9CHLO
MLAWAEAGLQQGCDHLRRHAPRHAMPRRGAALLLAALLALCCGGRALAQAFNPIASLPAAPASAPAAAAAPTPGGGDVDGVGLWAAAGPGMAAVAAAAGAAAPAGWLPSVVGVVQGRPDLTVLSAALAAANLSGWLSGAGEAFTLFAVADGGWADAFTHQGVLCTVAYMRADACQTAGDLLSSTSLRRTLLGYVANGAIRAADLPDMLRLAGGTVQPVSRTADGDTFVGSARLVVADVPAANGLVHLLDSVLVGDMAVNASAIALAERLGDFGPFNGSQREQVFGVLDTAFLQASASSLVRGYRNVRAAVGLPDGGILNPPPLQYQPLAVLARPLAQERSATPPLAPALPPSAGGADNESLAFMPVLELAALLRARKVTSRELTAVFTERLRRYDGVLEHVVTYTPALADAQAAAADQLFAAGVDLGPLQGIPYGLKDLFAVEGYRTTWGAPAFVSQVLPGSATVYQRLRNAGAVLVAKLATGEMAFDDVWWGGQVKNPWNIAQGSSGSSAGPAAAVAAGALPFAIGTETEGSLMAPAERCGATALRPTFGAIGRSGVMSLVDSLDKVGPFCRAAADCAAIYDILRGREADDPGSRDAALPDPATLNVSGLTIGMLPSAAPYASELTAALQARGVTVVPFGLNYTSPVQDIITVVMLTETAANFDFWQRSGAAETNRRQDFWPPLLRLARLIPSVEYIQAQRARGVLAREVTGAMAAAGLDAFIGNASEQLAMANLASLPTVAVPVGLEPLADAPGSARRHVLSAGIFGPPDSDSVVLALAMAWQAASGYHLQRPPIDAVEPEVLRACLPYSRCNLPTSVVAQLSPAASGARPRPLDAGMARATTSG